MKHNPLKQAVEQIQLNEEAKKRITLLCETKLTEVQPKQKKSLCFKLCVAAVVLVLSSVTVYAVSSGFGHMKVMDSEAEMYQDIKENEFTAYSISNPGMQPTTSLEEMVELSTEAAKHWTNPTFYGADQFIVKGKHCVMHGDSFQVVKNTAAFKKRKIYDSHMPHFVRTEYTAENPKDLQPFMKESVQMHPDISYGNYEAVPFGNMYYKVSDQKGKYYTEYFDVLYANAETGAWFQIGYLNQPTIPFFASEKEYTMADAYDEIYTYTTKEGFPFLIRKKGDTLWAACNNTHTYIDFYGGYMDTKEVEGILDHLGLHIAE